MVKSDHITILLSYHTTQCEFGWKYHFKLLCQFI